MLSTTDRLRLLRGVTAEPAPMRQLRAGPVTLLLDGGDLRYVRIGGHVRFLKADVDDLIMSHLVLD